MEPKRSLMKPHRTLGGLFLNGKIYNSDNKVAHSFSRNLGIFKNSMQNFTFLQVKLDVPRNKLLYK